MLALLGSVLHASERPNILIIMTDDLGYSDLGCYGSEIETPHLDRLANQGLRFSQFYNTAKCHSSRISLLTGQYAFQAGNTLLSKGVTSAEVLASAGYSTSMVGKWHLQKQPTDFGFERYWGHLSGACNFFKGDRTFRLNGEPWQVPSTGFYTTVANVDFALQFLNEARETKKPWYLYVAFNAPHAPLQPLEEDYKKYLGRYDAGWDSVRDARIARQKKLGLFGRDVAPSVRPGNIPAWDSLSEDRKSWESRRMTALAGMIDRVDQEVGRLLADLEEKDELDNTFILFVSDNGACPYDRRHIGFDREPYLPDTTWSDSTGWAWARNAPFRFYKQNQFEGGIATPGIVHWPAGLKTRSGSINHDPMHLIDVLPTVAELARAEIPEQWSDRELEPISGVSFAKVLAGKPAGPRTPIHLLFSSDRGLRDGDWKLVSFRQTAWELYHIPTDRAETRNVAADHPEIVKRLKAKWYEMAEHVLHAPEKARKPVLSSSSKVHPEWTNFSRKPGESNRPGRLQKSRPSIRARKDTRLSVEGGQLVLNCSGDDSGIAIDRLALPGTVKGPFRLTFRLQSQAGGSGEVYFTTDAKTILPKGTHITFDVIHDGQWHEYTLTLTTDKQLHALRLDPCSSPGVVRVDSLRLTDTAGNSLKSWPVK